MSDFNNDGAITMNEFASGMVILALRAPVPAAGVQISVFQHLEHGNVIMMLEIRRILFTLAQRRAQISAPGSRVHQLW